MIDRRAHLLRNPPALTGWELIGFHLAGQNLREQLYWDRDTALVLKIGDTFYELSSVLALEWTNKRDLHDAGVFIASDIIKAAPSSAYDPEN